MTLWARFLRMLESMCCSGWKLLLLSLILEVNMKDNKLNIAIQELRTLVRDIDIKVDYIIEKLSELFYKR